MIAYRAMIDVPTELVQHLGRLLAAERRARGTRRGTRALTSFYQALMVLVWFRKAEDLTLLGAGFGISRATAYRYRDEGIAVLAAQTVDLHTALRRAAIDGWSHGARFQPFESALLRNPHGRCVLLVGFEEDA